jgi:hypothetical protein
MRLPIGLALALSFVLTGCVGYVEGDGGDVVVAQPDMYLYGGYYDGGRSRDYGRRGVESRGRGSSRPAARSGPVTIVPAAAHSGGGGRHR